MKAQLQKKKLRIPMFGNFSPSLSFSDITEQVGLPFVLKPVDALGALGVYIIASEVEYANAIQHIIDSGHTYEFEEYLSGTLYHIDTLLQNGRIIFQVVCQYTAPNLDFQTGTSILSLPLLSTDPLAHQLKSFTTDCLHALGLTSGPAHTEVFVLANGDLVFLESAARTPGAVIVPHYEQQFGVNMIEAALPIELGNRLDRFNDDSDRYYCSGIFPTAQGVFSHKQSLPIVSEYQLEWKFQEGDIMPQPISLRNIAAAIFVHNADYNVLKQDFLTLIQSSPFTVNSAVNQIEPIH